MKHGTSPVVPRRTLHLLVRFGLVEGNGVPGMRELSKRLDSAFRPQHDGCHRNSLQYRVCRSSLLDVEALTRSGAVTGLMGRIHSARLAYSGVASGCSLPCARLDWFAGMPMDGCGSSWIILRYICFPRRRAAVQR